MGFSFDSFEQSSLGQVKFDVTEKLDNLNKSFKSGVEEVKGKFGEVEQSMGEITKNIDITEAGNAIKEYVVDEKVVKTVEKIGDGITKTTSFDDNGTAYLTEVADTVKGTIETKLTPDSEIHKGNVTTKIDSQGRVSSAKIDNIELKETGTRNNTELNNLEVDKKIYQEQGNQKGHMIPDRFGGAASYENITPENAKINQGVGKRAETFAAKLVEDGHEVTYEKTANYVGSSEIPSSYDVKITVDGMDSKDFIKETGEYKQYEDLPDKIYNNEDFSKGEMSNIEKVATDVGEVVGDFHEAGIESAKIAATVTCAISTVDNVTACLDGEITADEAVVNIAKDTVTAGAVGYGTGFVSSAVASAMESSSNQLISSLGNSNVPAAAVSFGIASYDTVIDYAQGEITTEELAYDLGENAVGVAGSIGGAALAGAAVGSVVPGAGTVVGATAGVVGGMVGYAVATGAYETVVEAAGDAIEEYSDELQQLGDKAKSIADDTIDKAAALGEDAVNNVKDAINNFNIQNALPF